MKYDEIKSLLQAIDDPVVKLEMLMDIGKTMPMIPHGKKGTEIKGCASRVEIWRGSDGKFYGAADSDLVKGIVAILIAIKEADAEFGEFAALNLGLGAGRLTGAAAMIEYLKNA